MSTENTDKTGVNWGGLASCAVAAVWLVHGLYNKLLHGSPRHLAIVQAVPGLAGVVGERVLVGVGLLEVAIALWVFSGRAAYICAAVQTTALLSMNAIELSVARPLLLWPAGLVPLNLGFLTLAWFGAATRRSALTWRVRLRRHPVAVSARLEECLTLTYALPSHVLARLLPPGLELDTFGGYGFVAIALVRTRALRPAGLPAWLGQEFFLSGYRVFTICRPADPDARPMRGLWILRSDADRRRMVAGANLLTHYNYHRCDARIVADAHRRDVSVRTDDGRGDLEIGADLSRATLPPGSPFPSIRDARRFAGPLPFTFDYEAETNAIIAVNATRTHWQPAPVTVHVRRTAFFDDPAFDGCTPILAAAFHVSGVDYRWARGVRYPLAAAQVRP
ncbi:MAG TPA: DUF2071 domain-containing protein [Vicinamibacterales bacterium]